MCDKSESGEKIAISDVVITDAMLLMVLLPQTEESDDINIDSFVVKCRRPRKKGKFQLSSFVDPTSKPQKVPLVEPEAKGPKPSIIDVQKQFEQWMASKTSKGLDLGFMVGN